MTFRHRITLVATAAVAVAVITASALTYVFVSNQLRGQVDNSLKSTAARLQRGVLELTAGGSGHDRRSLPDSVAPRVLLEHVKPLGGGRSRTTAQPFASLLRTPRALLAQDRGVVQLIGPGGKVLVAPGAGPVTLPVTARTRALAELGGGSYITDARLGSDHLRILTAALPSGTRAAAVQVARSLNEVDHTLSDLRLILVLVVIGGIGVAALLGALVSRAAVGPVSRLTATAEHIARTKDLARRIPVGSGGGELHRLAVSFNAMLDALEHSMDALDSSVRAQRQLVADTSHELRTPLASVRANIEVLQQSSGLSPEERERLLADVVEQLEDLTALINDVIELAREDRPSQALEELRLDEIVDEAIARIGLHLPNAHIEQDLQETVVLGDAARLSRAVSNLLDNALKFSASGSPVEVTLQNGELTVRDHGPGIAPADLPHAFDRFYRGENARGLPGSGLGLAIVRRVAESHGGSVSAQPATGGGTALSLRLPTLPVIRQEGLPAGRA